MTSFRIGCKKKNVKRCVLHRFTKKKKKGAETALFGRKSKLLLLRKAGEPVPKKPAAMSISVSYIYKICSQIYYNSSIFKKYKN